MTDFSDKQQRIKNFSAIYDNPTLKSIEALQKIINNKTPEFSWLQTINKITINNPLSDLIELTTSKSKLYLSAFKVIEMLNSNSWIDIINRLEYRTYDFADVIEDFDDQTYSNEKRPEKSTVNIIIKVSNLIANLLSDIYFDNEKLYKLSPREFEKVIAELLCSKGFEVELTKQTRDNGFDILALKHMDSLSPIKYLVECKRYKPSRKIGVEIIRSFKEVLQTEHANKGLIVTTSYFSSEAIKKKNEAPYLLDYKDKDELINWVNEYYKGKNWVV